MVNIALYAENKTILISETSLPYTSQSWFHRGNINDIKDPIKKYWDEGKCITSVAYTSNGWFVTMAKNTGLSWQSYKISSQWPSEWLKQKSEEGRVITSCTYGNSQWLIVVSKKSAYTAQIWKGDELAEEKAWIKKQWDNGYYITETAYNGSYWVVVMSKTDEMTAQGYCWGKTVEEIKDKIRKNIWDQGYNLQLLNYGDGEFFAVYCKYAKNNGRGQSYRIRTPSTSVSEYIQEIWDSSKQIAYIGGGDENAQYSSQPTNPSKSAPKSATGQPTRQNLPGGGYIEYTQQSDGRMMMKTVMPCNMCHGSNVCTSCWGQGGRWGAAYGGTWYPCVLCAGTGKNCCRVCNGKGEIITIAFSDGNGNAYGVSSNGTTSTSNSAGTIVNTPYGTKVYPNGGSGSSSSSSSSKSSSDENKYIEEIVYAPDYTGNSTQVWCDKCNKYGPRHSHIKKRVY